MSAGSPPDPATAGAEGLEERIARIEVPAEALALAEVVLAGFDSGAWQCWKMLAAAPLAGWLYGASRSAAAGGRIGWILGALPQRDGWTRAAGYAAGHPLLSDGLRSVSVLEDRPFHAVGALLERALSPWQPAAGGHQGPAGAGGR